MRMNDEPESTEIKIVDGVFLKANRFPRAGMIGIQHAHTYPHISHISSGAVRLSINGKHLGDYEAGASIEIAARARHQFETLRDNTVVLCIHNADHAEDGEPLIEDLG